MEKLIQTAETLMPFEHFDALGVGVINFAQGKFQSFETLKNEDKPLTQSPGAIYYDLASLTKPLTNSLSYFLDPASFDKNLLACLNHQAGLPSWGLLPKAGWKEQILSYKITPDSPTLYSDFSALRVMLELEKIGINQKKICSTIWDKETLFWRDLPAGAPLLQYGFRNGEANFGEVHDPNAWVIGDFCSHAGLFSTLPGLCRSLINYQTQTDFISKIRKVSETHSPRFIYGWDRVEDASKTLAGSGCGKKTFGHLGFTGTSIWIDPDQMVGHVILSNATKYYWYDKQGLNELRRAIGELIWSGQF